MRWRMPLGEFRALPDSEQDEMIAYVRDVCPRCGNLRSVCSDPEYVGYPQRSMCYATAVEELAYRQLRAKYEKNKPGVEDLHPTDGMRVWVSTENLTPEDDFLAPYA